MNIEYKTPKELKQLALNSHKETKAFIKRLKNKKPKNLDSVIHDLHNQAFSYFDCLDCANCCKTIGPRITDKDIERLAKLQKVKPVQFIKKYIIKDEDGDYVFNQHPCPFLLPDNYCSVYEQRPKACKEYPHTDRKRMYQILDLTYKNSETCPVVFSILEELKNVIE